jgi:DnaJ-class molecular chaperone
MVEDDPLDQLPPDMRKGCNNFYHLFGVEPEVSADRIQSAYREMVKEYHPDNSNHPHAEAISYTINEAKDVLLDENERLVYNEVGHTNYYKRGKVADPFDSIEDETEDEYDSSLYELISMADLSRASSEPWWKSVIKSSGFKITLFILFVLSLLILLLISY